MNECKLCEFCTISPTIVDNETYLKETEIDRNWQIPREKLQIRGEAEESLVLYTKACI